MNVRQHAHGLDHLRVAQGTVRILLCRYGTSVGHDQGWLCAELIEPGNVGLDHGRSKGAPAQNRIHPENQCQEYQRSGCLHAGKQHRNVEKLADRAEVIHGL